MTDANKKLAEEVYSKIEAYPYTRVQIIEYLAAALERRYREGVEAIVRALKYYGIVIDATRLLAEGKEGEK